MNPLALLNLQYQNNLANLLKRQQQAAVAQHGTEAHKLAQLAQASALSATTSMTPNQLQTSSTANLPRKRRSSSDLSSSSGISANKVLTIAGQAQRSMHRV